MRPHRRQPTRLTRPWDSPGKNTGVGCHFLLQCMKVKSESEVAQSCLTLSDPMDCSLPGSSIHGIFQARVLEWGAMPKFKHIWEIWEDGEYRKVWLFQNPPPPPRLKIEHKDSKRITHDTIVNKAVWISQVVQGIRICLPVEGTRVQSLVQEDRTCCRATMPDPWAITTEAHRPGAHAHKRSRCCEKPKLCN